MRQPVQFGLHKRNQLFECSLVSAAPVAQQLGDFLLPIEKASSYRLIDTANFNTVEGFLQPDGFFRISRAVVVGSQRDFRFTR